MRITTYNIHKCRGLDGRVRPGRIVNVLKEVDADVIALQEVLNIEGSKKEHNQAAFIAQELGLSPSIGKSRILRGGVYGNATMSRLKMIGSHQYDLSVPLREPRGCLRVDLKTEEGRLIHVFNVHMGTGFKERRKQVNKLATKDILMNPQLKGSRIVLGDFNEWTRGLTTRLLAEHFQSVQVDKDLPFLRTYPGFFPFLHLDHIYFEKELELKSLRIHRSRTALIASDHLPIVAEFSLN
jgi:endonuclease/exonuclease/phosphatase family metal-dependent hydrolase